jgi:tetratricopeptide (TPR) repeat protein
MNYLPKRGFTILMKNIFRTIWAGSLGLVLFACGQEVNREEIHELPTFNAAYYQEVLGVLNEEVENYPEYADAYFKKAEVLEKLNNPENAIINYRKAIKLDSTNAAYYKSLARIFATQDKLKRAEENALKAVQLGDQSADLHQLFTLIYEKNGEYSLAMNHANKAIKSSPGNSDYITSKGRLYLQQHDTLRAKEFLLDNQHKLKRQKDVYQVFADIYLFERKYPEALAYIDSSLLVAAGSELPLLLKKADILQKAGQNVAAKKMLNSYLKEDSVNFAVTYKLAEVHYNSYGYDSALYYLNKALLLEDKNKKAFLLMGRVYDRKRMYYSARDQFQNALLIDTSYQEAKQAMDALNRKLAYIYRMRKAEEENNSLPQAETVKPKIQN